MTDRKMKWFGVMRLVLLSIVFLSLTVGMQADGNDPCSASAILSEMRSYYPVPISASPDGKLIVAWARPEGQTDSGLEVIDSQSQKVIRALKWSEPMIHVLWKPDGQSVSFFSQETGTNLRHLMVWNLEDGKTREIPTLPTFNQPHVLWSPDGSRLAYSQETKGIVIVSNTRSTQPIIYPGKFAIFAWSNDSLNLALVPDDESHQVIVVDGATQRLVQRITTNISGKLVDVAWQPRKNMLLLLEHKDGSRYVVEYDATKGTERILFSWSLDLRSPAWLPLGQGYIFQRLQNGTGDLFIGSEKDGVEPRRLPLDGISDFRSVLPDGKSISVTHRSVGPVEILKIPLDTAKPQVLATANLSALGTVSPEQTFVTSSDGMKVPLLVWRSPNANPNSRAAVVRVHGNLHGAETPVWQEDIQMYLKHGVDFVAVNYRGSSGYGSDFQKSGTDEQRARDVVAACEYAHSVLGIPYGRVVVLGHSNGATIAMGAGLIQPDHIGILVLASLAGLPRGWEGYGGSEHSRPQVILALHGERDRHLPPPFARALIEKVFGQDVLTPLDTHWQVLPGEDHVLHLDSSWAVVHSTILKQLGLSSCGPP